MRILAVAASAAVMSLALSAAASAADPASAPKGAAAAPTAADTQKKDDPNRVICKAQEVTGSAIPRAKICRTKRDWDQLTEESRQAMGNNHAYNPDRQ